MLGWPVEKSPWLLLLLLLLLLAMPPKCDQHLSNFGDKLTPEIGGRDCLAGGSVARSVAANGRADKRGPADSDGRRHRGNNNLPAD